MVPNLMIGFGIDETQAEYVAEIRLRHLNREYILKRLEEMKKLEEEIAELEGILESEQKVKKIIVTELTAISEKYGQDRKSAILYSVEEAEIVEEAPDYPVHLFLTREGYFKKVTPQSLRMSTEHKLKEGDALSQQIEATNNTDLLFFTDQCKVYKANASDFEDIRISVLGDYTPAKLGMDEGETVVYLAATKDYSGYMLFAFENGKLAKVSFEKYATKTNRKKLVNAYSAKSPLSGILHLTEDCEVLFQSTSRRMLLVHTGAVAVKSTRDTIGVAAMTLKANHKVSSMQIYREGLLAKPDRYRTKNIPATGSLPAQEDIGEQLTL